MEVIRNPSHSIHNLWWLGSMVMHKNHGQCEESDLRKRRLRSYELLQHDLNPPEQPGRQAFASIVHQIAHVKPPYQFCQVTFPDMGVDRRADGSNELFEIVSGNVRSVV